VNKGYLIRQGTREDDKVQKHFKNGGRIDFVSPKRRKRAERTSARGGGGGGTLGWEGSRLFPGEMENTLDAEDLAGNRKGSKGGGMIRVAGIQLSKLGGTTGRLWEYQDRRGKKMA